eukprot:Skav222663  [mRNA]  locus=scaffold997:445599:450032:- [translate_table: standard]
MQQGELGIVRNVVRGFRMHKKGLLSVIRRHQIAGSDEVIQCHFASFGQVEARASTEGPISRAAQIDVNHVGSIDSLDNGSDPPVGHRLRERRCAEAFREVVPELLREGGRNAPTQSLLNFWA